MPEGGKVARRSRDGEGKDAAKKQKTQRYKPCLSETSYRNAAGVISPGLPSQALARQLSQRESPWQRGFVFDETDLRLLENVAGCQSLSLWERCLRSRRRGQGCCQRARHTAIRTLLVRAIVSLCFRVLFCRACPLRRWRASSPKGRALGKEVSFSMKPICVCRKTSRNAKASHFERLPRPGEVARKCQKGTRWHGEAVTERARMLTKNKKHSDTSPVCQRHRIAVLSCFILPGLPSQALARQLSQRESPWQRGQALVYASMPWSAGG